MNMQRQPAKPAVVVAAADPDRVTILGRLVHVLVCDYDLITTTTGAAVLDHIATCRVPLVVVGDEVLDMEVLQLRSAIKANSPATRMLVISGDAYPSLEPVAWATQVDHYLPRPFEIDQLEEVVRVALVDPVAAAEHPQGA
jgi:DNA-binding NtrC family response regulator